MPTAVAPARKVRKPRGETWMIVVTVGVIMVFIVVLLIVPILMALRGSFHEWNPLNGTFRWVGVDNYVRLFSDPVFGRAAFNTAVFGFAAIAGRVLIGLAIAYALFSKLTKWKGFFRTIFYMPTITPLVAVAYVWKLMYNPQFGAINSFFGFDINWLFDSRFSLLAIILMTIWKDFGYAVILLLAGLYSVPEDALEAAAVDGANAWQRFWRVTLPLLRPMLFFVIITSLIAYLQAFVQVLVLTEGGPGTSTQIISYMIYEQAFVKYNFGYASAIAFVLLVVTALLTAASWRFNQSGGTERSRRGRRKAKANQAAAGAEIEGMSV